ncbi:MAG: hypothetical protein QM765_47900 [Myxococcales bacterium]
MASKRTLTLALFLLLLSPALARAQEPKMALKTSNLQFETKAEGERHQALRAWMEKKAAGGWKHQPLQVAGNFLTERWCGPKVATDVCAAGSVVTNEQRGTEWMTLEALHYELPKAFGLVVNLGHFPEKGDLAVRFYVAEGGKSIVGEAMGATFLVLGKDGKVSEQVTVGERASFQILDTELSASSPDPWRATLKKMAASPKSLETLATQMLDALQARVDEALAKGEVLGFDEGEYKGDGVPPMKTPRPLTAAEKEREAKAAKAEIARRKAFVAKHAKAMHALLVDKVPVDLF